MCQFLRFLTILAIAVPVLTNSSFAAQNMNDNLIKAAYCQGVLQKWWQVYGGIESDSLASQQKNVKNRLLRHMNYVNAYTSENSVNASALVPIETQGMEDFQSSTDPAYIREFEQRMGVCVKECTPPNKPDCAKQCLQKVDSSLAGQFVAIAKVKKCITGDLPF